MKFMQVSGARKRAGTCIDAENRLSRLPVIKDDFHGKGVCPAAAASKGLKIAVSCEPTANIQEKRSINMVYQGRSSSCTLKCLRSD